MTMTETRPAFAPMERDTIQLRIYDRLRQALMAGLFAPGQVLIVRALAEEFQTSQMPVRDALSRLVAEQALEMTSSRSLAVPVLSHARWLEVLLLRTVLEGTATELATESLTPAALAELADQTRLMRAALDRRDVQTYLETNRRFHFTIYEAAARPLMLRMIETLWLQIGPTIRRKIDLKFETPEIDARTALSRHDAIIDALTRRDVAAARHAIEDDITNGVDPRTGMESASQQRPLRRAAKAASGE